MKLLKSWKFWAFLIAAGAAGFFGYNYFRTKKATVKSVKWDAPNEVIFDTPAGEYVYNWPNETPALAANNYTFSSEKDGMKVAFTLRKNGKIVQVINADFFEEKIEL